MSQKEGVTALERTPIFPLTFVDVLSLAVAQSGNSEFTADWERWHSAIADFIEEKATDDNPLGDIHFQRREPYAPFSEEVEAFLSIMRRSGCFAVLNQRGRSSYMIDQETRTQIITRRDERLDDQQNSIAELAEKINNSLGIK